MIKLNEYTKIYKTSQSGEEGIIAKIFDDLNITNGFFCEFGAGDGISNCNTYFLSQTGWEGLYIEIDNDKFKNLSLLHNNNPKIKLINNKVSLELNETLDEYLKKSEAPKNFDLLSIDIDGNDLWIWESLKNYKPKVVVVEYNSHFESEKSLTIPYDKNHKHNHDNFYSASIGAFNKLAQIKGYDLVGYTLGLNLFFIDKNLNKNLYHIYDIRKIPVNIGWPPSNKKMISY